MDSIEDIYQEQTARIFLLLVHARSPLSAIGFWFFETESEDSDYAMKAEVKPLEDSEGVLISKRMCIRLNAYCKDLVEVSVNSSSSEFAILPPPQFPPISAFLRFELL